MLEINNLRFHRKLNVTERLKIILFIIGMCIKLIKASTIVYRKRHLAENMVVVKLRYNRY